MKLTGILDSYGVGPFLFLLFFAGASFLHNDQLPASRLSTERLVHLHYHKAVFNIDAPGDKYEESPSGRVYYNEKPVAGIGGLEAVDFIYEKDNLRWSGIFPVPWSAPNGVYTLHLDDGTRKDFIVRSRAPARLPEEPLKVMNLESTRRISRINYTDPWGEPAGYSGMFDWIKYLGGNTLWYLAGQTASYTEGDIDADFPWLKSNMETLEEFAAASKENNVGFGAWIICYRTFGINSLKPDYYSYSMNFRNSRIAESQGISINDRRRLNHIKDLARRLNRMDNIDYVGLDYIRPAGGAFELVDHFVASMRVEVPEDWHGRTDEERMAWLGSIVSRTENRDFTVTDKWNWWRAHRMANIIVDIRESVEFTKPLWAFVLSWELGRQHGQDPVMFSDAGIDVLAIMMYETDTARFNHLIREWEKYTEGFRLNLMPGNQIDWPLHQHTVYPSGPEEFYRRIESSVEHLGNNVKGVFVNDLSRASVGRRGPYNMREWLLVSGKALSLAGDNPAISIELEVPESKQNSYEAEGYLNVRNLTEKTLENITLEFPAVPGVFIDSEIDTIQALGQGSTARVKYTIRIEGKSSRRMGRYMAAARAVHDERTYIDYRYLWVEGLPPDPGWRYR